LPTQNQSLLNIKCWV